MATLSLSAHHNKDKCYFPPLSPPRVQALLLGVMRGAKPAGGARCNFDIYVTVIVELFK